MDSLLSFPVGLLHPLQHAGLSRRSPVDNPLRTLSFGEQEGRPTSAFFRFGEYSSFAVSNST